MTLWDEAPAGQPRAPFRRRRAMRIFFYSVPYLLYTMRKKSVTNFFFLLHHLQSHPYSVAHVQKTVCKHFQCLMSSRTNLCQPLYRVIYSTHLLRWFDFLRCSFEKKTLRSERADCQAVIKAALILLPFFFFIFFIFLLLLQTLCTKTKLHYIPSVIKHCSTNLKQITR